MGLGCDENDCMCGETTVACVGSAVKVVALVAHSDASGATK